MISFSDGGLARIHHPHNDGLIITLRVANFKVKGILINQGSSSEVMYIGLFQKLNMKEEDLKKVYATLVKFNKNVVLPIGKNHLTNTGKTDSYKEGFFGSGFGISL